MNESSSRPTLHVLPIPVWFFLTKVVNAWDGSSSITLATTSRLWRRYRCHSVCCYGYQARNKKHRVGYEASTIFIWASFDNRPHSQKVRRKKEKNKKAMFQVYRRDNDTSSLETNHCWEHDQRNRPELFYGRHDVTIFLQGIYVQCFINNNNNRCARSDRVLRHHREPHHPAPPAGPGCTWTGFCSEPLWVGDPGRLCTWNQSPVTHKHNKDLWWFVWDSNSTVQASMRR